MLQVDRDAQIDRLVAALAVVTGANVEDLKSALFFGDGPLKLYYCFNVGGLVPFNLLDFNNLRNDVVYVVAVREALLGFYRDAHAHIGDIITHLEGKG